MTPQIESKLKMAFKPFMDLTLDLASASPHTPSSLGTPHGSMLLHATTPLHMPFQESTPLPYANILAVLPRHLGKLSLTLSSC